MGAELSVRDVRHRRGRREVLRLAALEVAPGERLGLLGPNGAGKTSLLRLLGALEPPTSGSVRIDGLDTRDGGHRLRRRIGVAPQRPVLLSISAAANVELALRYRGVPRAERPARAREALARVGAAALADRRARMLSGGESQRVSLARALAPGPDLLLLDEPAAALDAPSRVAFLADLAEALRDRAATVVHVSHRPEDLVGSADRLAVIVAGEIRQVGRPDALLAAPADPEVARLVGYENVLDARVGLCGDIVVAGRPTGIAVPRAPGPVTLAVWASGVRTADPATSAWVGVVTAAVSVAGRRELRIDAGLTLRAQAPLGRPRVEVGERVGIDLDPTLLVLLHRMAEDPRPRPRPSAVGLLKAVAPPAR